jgi:hypothetical protein
MAGTDIKRRRPCDECGGRYFASTYTPVTVFIAMVAAVGGIAMTIIRTGVFTGVTPQLDLAFGDFAWAIGGVAIAIAAGAIGHRYRCIRCAD